MKNVIDIVEQELAHFTPFLYGSREKYRSISHNSDFDFAVQDSEEFRQHALSLGYFESPISDAYRDNLSVSVFSKTLVVDSTEYSIQIISKRDLNFFKMLWNSISAGYYYLYLWKQNTVPYEEECEKKLFIRDFINQAARTQATALLTVKTIFANIDLEKHLGVKMSTIEALAQQSCEELPDTEFFNALRDAEDIAALGIEYARDVHSLLGKILQDAETHVY
jgi:hypothetical protein